MELNAVEDGAAVEEVVVDENAVAEGVVVDDGGTVVEVDEVVVVVELPPPAPKVAQVAPKSPVFLKVSATRVAPLPIETSNLVFWP